MNVLTKFMVRRKELIAEYNSQFCSVWDLFRNVILYKEIHNLWLNNKPMYPRCTIKIIKPII